MAGCSYSETNTHMLRFVQIPFERLCFEFWVSSISRPRCLFRFERLGEILKPWQQNTHTHTCPPSKMYHNLPSGLFLWLRTNIIGAEVSSTETPPPFLPLLFLSLCLTRLKRRRTLHLPHLHITLTFQWGEKSDVVIDVIQWEWRCRAWIIDSPWHRAEISEDTPKLE